MEKNCVRPNPRNTCGGMHDDWLEVMLTPKCNAKCKWCIDKKLGYHPKCEPLNADQLTEVILSLKDKKNIMLLGGEPTMYDDIRALIVNLFRADKNVYITTNGTGYYRISELYNEIAGLNVSFHGLTPEENHKITGVFIPIKDLHSHSYMQHLSMNKTKVRFNCNLIKGHIDSKEKILEYIKFAKSLGIKEVRFAELKHDDGNFVELDKIFQGKYGLNDDPYIYGCSCNAEIDGVSVNFRQMCGIQCDKRKKNYIYDNGCFAHHVVYYDGTIHNGWQSKKDEKRNEELKEMREEITKIIKLVSTGELTQEQARVLIEYEAEKKIVEKVYRQTKTSGGGCTY